MINFMRTFEPDDLDLQLFAEGAAGGEGGEGTAAESADTDIDIQEGILPDGTKVDRRLAERMKSQRKRNPDLYRTAAQPDEQQQATRKQQEPNQGENADDAWQAIKKQYAEQYGRDVKAAVQDRFKNQTDLQGQLDGLKPMLDALAKQRGIQAGDYQALSQSILDDDSLYEEDAEAAGMTVPAYKTFLQVKQEAEAAKAKAAQDEQQNFFQQHLRGLVEQAEQMKAMYPDFDLGRELQDPRFKRMTSPDVGLSVADAFYAVHHAELEPRAAQIGMQHAQRQIAQSLQANAKRPVEGAMTGNQQAAKIAIDPRNMTREQRQRLKEDLSRRTARGEKVYLD